jgi:CubicO group peptidase (beta-lactamase class C family)
MMIKLRHWQEVSFIVLGILLAQLSAFGQQLSKQAKNRVDSILNEYAFSDGPGYSMALIKDKRMVYEKSVGYSDPETKQPATQFTNYRLASVTKQFTALAILQLNEAKKLSVEDDIQKYLPSLPAYAKNIKIKHLLDHISGLVDYEDLTNGYPGTVVDADVLKLLSKQDTTKFVPGTKYDYSNSGYSLLASIIEKVSGQTYAQYITAHIFKPLKMDHSSFNIQQMEIPNRAYGYTKKGKVFERTDQSSTSFVLGDGGIYSSVNDMMKWENSLLKDKLIKGNPLQQANTYGFDLGPNDRYACGWRITKKHNVLIYNHTGGSRGFLTYHVFIPELKLGMIFLTNRTGDFDPYKVGDKIVEAMLK